MKKVFVGMMIVLGMLIGVGAVSATTSTDIIEWDTGFFTPNESSTYVAPYYRWYDEDWGWKHNAIVKHSQAQL